MNGQQREAIEKIAQFFPRGLLAVTIEPDGRVVGRLQHESLTKQRTFITAADEPDVIVLDRIRELILEEEDE